jgi:hypothetical protein
MKIETNPFKRVIVGALIVTICAKYFQNPLNYEEVIDRTQNIPYNRL